MAMEQPALQRAVDIAGSQAKLADLIGAKQQYIWHWLHKAKLGVPAEYVIPIEQATEGKVPRHELRPDIYPKVAA